MQLVPAFRSRRRRPRLIVLAFKPSLVVVFFASDGVMERNGPCGIMTEKLSAMSELPPRPREWE